MLIYTIIPMGVSLAIVAMVIEMVAGERPGAWTGLYAFLGMLGAAIGAFLGLGDAPFLLRHPFLNTLSLSYIVAALLVLCGLALHNRSGLAGQSRHWRRVLVIYLGAAAVLLLPFFFYNPLGGAKAIALEIEKANYCERDSDCVQLAGQCPFGCYIYVNQSQAERIKELVAGYQSRCVYGCTAPPPFSCQNNKCLPDLAKKIIDARPLTGWPSGFDECVRAGNAVMEGDPRQCQMDGVTYSEMKYQTGSFVNQECASAADCGQTPMEFAIMSNCPYSAACAGGSCAVICAMYEHDHNPEVSRSYAAGCEADKDCDCSDWDRERIFPCECLDGQCASVVAGKEIFRDLLAAKHDWDPALLEVSLTKMGVTHAQGNVRFMMKPNDREGGGYFFAARTSKGWEIVLDGNGGIPCGLLDKYKFPDSMRTQCYEEEAASPADQKAAAAALTGFFSALSDGRYEDALDYFAPETVDPGAWEWLAGFSPEEGSDRAEILKNYCAAVGTCLPARIISARESGHNYDFAVNFVEPDGRNFVLGPCCGATAEEMPPTETFSYTVFKGENGYRVVNPPQYVP